ncbi:AN1-type zinc finger protein 2A-like protein [Dinothrombium tinctorium]|uniref:AN1-type zinc finger protein 2A-like protein n=1 Tax=Dinothrombium tinctorium TaxID=1965070 RepID=A0A3S3P2E0_9ACAR|nr:AN1-type zinc finger protein 2A-like protein [Dinothrombium tinctorium]
MEFPNLGEQCSVSSCKQLDFLPFKCDACRNVFCKQHFLYAAHSCKEAALKDNLVPVCPLCNEPVPCRKGETADVAVSQHIDEDCKDERATGKRNTVYSNKCSLRHCKNKELIPLVCKFCERNFCLKHRHPTDHKCDKEQVGQPTAQSLPSKNAAAAALERISKLNAVSNSNQSHKPSHTENQAFTVQGNLSEEEALQKALEMSLADAGRTNISIPLQNTSILQEEEDRLLAAAISESEREYNKNKNKCYLS